MCKHSLAIIIPKFCRILIGLAIRVSYGQLLPEMLPSLGMLKTEAGLIMKGNSRRPSPIQDYTNLHPKIGLKVNNY